YSRGIVRVYDRNEDIRQLAYDSIQSLLRWENLRLPGKSPYTESGFLYLTDENELPDIEKHIQELMEKNYPVDILSGQNLKKLVPWLKDRKGVAGIYEKRGGYGDPGLTAFNFASGFQEKGGVLFENTETIGIEKDRDRWQVNLKNGKVTGRVVLVTTGGWTGTLIPGLPVFARTIPLTQVLKKDWKLDISVVDEKAKTYMRPHQGATFYCGSQKHRSATNIDLLDLSSDGVVEDSIERLEKLVDKKRQFATLNHMVGYDGYTEQGKPIVQFIPEEQGLYVAAGMSGLGYKCSIALSKEIARQISNYVVKGSSDNPIKWRMPL
ncbi:MAG: FAD-dependent oxidoreductase, partial [Cyclobacteriaceae bacterium]